MNTRCVLSLVTLSLRAESIEVLKVADQNQRCQKYYRLAQVRPELSSDQQFELVKSRQWVGWCQYMKRRK